MASLPTPPRLGYRLPPPPAPRDPDAEGDDDGGLRSGDLIDGRYEIGDRIGEGGVGVVYCALQLKLHRRVAIKVLQEQTDEGSRPRFEREAVTLAALSHPNIVSVQDYGHTRGKPFLVMELLAGRTLRELMDAEGPLPVSRALALTREVLHALAYAHDLGIVHRDLKPANLLVQALPSHEHVKVLDFGFVKLLPGSYLDRGVQLSRVGFTFGTPAYMSPEHATGGEIDGRSDLYSMGILLFEMLTAEKPFDGDISELIRHHLATPIPKLADRRPELAGRADLQAIIDRALAKARDQRFANAAEFLQAIEAIQSGATASLAFGGNGTANTNAAGASRVLAFRAQLARGRAATKQFLQAMWLLLRQRSGPAFDRNFLRLQLTTTRIARLIQQRARAVWNEAGPLVQRCRAWLSHAAKELSTRAQGRIITLPDDPPETASPAAKGQNHVAPASTPPLADRSETSTSQERTIAPTGDDSRAVADRHTP